MAKVYVALTTDPRARTRRVVLGAYTTPEQAREHLNTHLLAWYYGEYKETHVRPSMKSLMRQYERETGGHAMVITRQLVPKKKKSKAKPTRS